MSNGIFLIREDKLVEMSEQSYDSEDKLQKLLADYPDLLAGGQINSESPRRWLLIKREMGLPSSDQGSNRWSIDLFLLDQDGIPTIVEVKRSNNPEIRRKVVGQMLDYAANAVVYWPVEHLKETFISENDKHEELLARFLEDEFTPKEFWEKVERNLQTGKVRMLFVADKIPPELRRIIEFLNEQMNSAEVLAVEIKQFVGSDMKTLVPRVIGQTTKAEATKGKKQTNEARLAFWTAFLKTAKNIAPNLQVGRLTDAASMKFAVDAPDLTITCVASYSSGGLMVRLLLKGPNAKKDLERLLKYTTTNSESLMTWESGCGKKGSGNLYLSTIRKLNLEDENSWPEQHQWIIDAIEELQDKIIPTIEENS